MSTHDLTTITAAVAQRVWDEQQMDRTHPASWEHLLPATQHSALEAVLPFVRATLDVIDGYGHTITEETTRRVMGLLDNLDTSDPEAAHSTVDELLLDLVPDQVSEAVQRVVRRADWWAGA